MLWPSRGDGQDVAAQPRLIEPARHRVAQNAAAHPAMPSDDEKTALPRRTRRGDKARERAMRFLLGEAMEIEAAIDRVTAPLQPLQGSTVDPGAAVEQRTRQFSPHPSAAFASDDLPRDPRVKPGEVRITQRASLRRWCAAGQRFDAANDAAPQLALLCLQPAHPYPVLAR